MTILVVTKTGDNNLEFELPEAQWGGMGSTEAEVFGHFLKTLIDRGGYVTKNRHGKPVFVPYHQVDYVEQSE